MSQSARFSCRDNVERYGVDENAAARKGVPTARISSRQSPWRFAGWLTRTRSSCWRERGEQFLVGVAMVDMAGGNVAHSLQEC